MISLKRIKVVRTLINNLKDLKEKADKHKECSAR